MKNFLTSATKKRLIQELRDILFRHPRYRADSQNVQNKFSFAERPQRGIIINNTSADRVRLSADNYIGRQLSFCMLTYFDHKPCTSLEWVKENIPLLETYSPKRDIFPTPPGVYTINIESEPDTNNLPGYFTVDPVLTVADEPLIQFGSNLTGQEAQLSRQDIYPDAVRLWLDGRIPLIRNVDYTCNFATGEITFLKSPPIGEVIYADYRYKLSKQGPFPYYRDSTDSTTIPGVIMAFGDRVQKCDQLNLVITSSRTPTNECFGGKFDVHFDLIAFTRDAEDRERMSDYIIEQILERQNSLGYEGIELIDISPGGESEEVYNETTDEYYYESAISVSFRVDWEYYIPLPVELWRIEETSKELEDQAGHLDGSYYLDKLKAGLPIDVLGAKLTSAGDISYERIQ